MILRLKAEDFNSQIQKISSQSSKFFLKKITSSDSNSSRNKLIKELSKSPNVNIKPEVSTTQAIEKSWQNSKNYQKNFQFY